ncbi:MAG: redoxin domain-containing protein [Verrucomicrobiales bacterium]|nr:redoxin domain-containing protein [Verrucomicrobiales bacterium]
MKRSLFAATALFLASIQGSPAIDANTPSGELGMDAPPLKIAKWIQGGPVDMTAGKGKNIYVVEFWATWCGPCRTSIPHLDQLQERFKDRGVVFIGVSNEKPEKVEPFVKSMGAKMRYAVAVDDADASVGAYLRAFGVEGIPHAFVIDKQGKVAWHGHPMTSLDRALEEMVNGKYDIEATKKTMALAKLMPTYFEQAAQGSETPETKALGERIVKEGANEPALLNEFAWIILTHPKIQKRDLDLATRAAKGAFDKSAGKDASIIDTYARAQFQNGKVADAIDLQKKAIAAADTDEARQGMTKALKEYEAAQK